MLFFPLLDPQWQPPAVPDRLRNRISWLALVVLASTLLVWKPAYLEASLSTLVTAALPEEWFFRAYFMTSAGTGFTANVVASILFSTLHGLTRGWQIAALVFVPSLFYGWLYRRTRDFPLLVLAHALSNIMFMMFIATYAGRWIGAG